LWVNLLRLIKNVLIAKERELLFLNRRGEMNVTLENPTKEQLECKHEKVYSNFVLASNPPIYSWICSKCGVRGKERAEYVDYNEYDKLVFRFYGNKA